MGFLLSLAVVLNAHSRGRFSMGVPVARLGTYHCLLAALESRLLASTFFRVVEDERWYLLPFAMPLALLLHRRGRPLQHLEVVVAVLSALFPCWRPGAVRFLAARATGLGVMVELLPPLLQAGIAAAGAVYAAISSPCNISFCFSFPQYPPTFLCLFRV